VTYVYGKKYIFFKISVFNKIWYNFMGWEIKSVKLLKYKKVYFVQVTKIQKSVLRSSKGLNKRVLYANF